MEYKQAKRLSNICLWAVITLFLLMVGIVVTGIIMGVDPKILCAIEGVIIFFIMIIIIPEVNFVRPIWEKKGN